MRDLLSRLLEYLAQGQPVVYCRLVATRGSTPQKAGAAMLVLANGSQYGTLGGGCVEAEVKRAALTALADGGPRRVQFQLDHDYGWDDGLICGGRMDILIWPLNDLRAQPYFLELAQLYAGGGGGTEAICAVNCHKGGDESGNNGPHPLSELPPACFVFDKDGQLRQTLTDVACLAPEVPKYVTAYLPPWQRQAKPQGIAGILYLPIPMKYRLLIVGAGHVGLAVAKLAADLDFDVWVIDDRAELVTEQRFPMATRRIAGEFQQLLPELAGQAATYCLIVTRGHNHDQEALFHLVESGAEYIGMIGSQRKIRLIFANLRAEGISEAALKAVHAPVGIDIGSQTVPEIAVSIAAELVAYRNRKGVILGRPRLSRVIPDETTS